MSKFNEILHVYQLYHDSSINEISVNYPYMFTLNKLKMFITAGGPLKAAHSLLLQLFRLFIIYLLYLDFLLVSYKINVGVIDLSHTQVFFSLFFTILFFTFPLFSSTFSFFLSFPT